MQVVVVDDNLPSLLMTKHADCFVVNSFVSNLSIRYNSELKGHDTLSLCSVLHPHQSIIRWEPGYGIEQLNYCY